MKAVADYLRRFRDDCPISDLWAGDPWEDTYCMPLRTTDSPFKCEKDCVTYKFAHRGGGLAVSLDDDSIIHSDDLPECLYVPIEWDEDGEVETKELRYDHGRVLKSRYDEKKKDWAALVKMEEMPEPNEVWLMWRDLAWY